ncbi:phosphoesterase, partial [Gemmiger formicilis]|nr:phosphoesterase [Gemmiger formicilis]
MFLKQHSVLDVFGAVIMAYVLYKVVYEPEKKMIPQLSKQKFSKQKRIAAHNK